MRKVRPAPAASAVTQVPGDSQAGERCRILADILTGKGLYLEWGRPNKRIIELTPKNLMSRMEVFAAQKLRKVARPNMWRVLATMLASRKYSLGGEWGGSTRT